MSVKSIIVKVLLVSGMLLAIFAVLAGSLFFYIFKPTTRDFSIINPEQLISECQQLVELKQQGNLTLDESDQWTRGSITSTQWPPSIVALQPRGVYVLDDRVSILLSTGGIGPSFGYVIPYLPKTNFNYLGRGRTQIGNSYVRKTEHKNIYSWSEIE